MIERQMFIPPSVRTWAEIDLGAIRHNLDFVRARIGQKSGVMAIVKANAYGHGMPEVAAALASGVELFGVANVAEAETLKACNLNRDILLLGPCLPAERADALRNQFIVTVSSAKEAATYDALGKTRVNFKVDTGMGRIGSWQEEAVSDMEQIARMPNIQVHSLSTHLPVSDEDDVYTRAQLERFDALVAIMKKSAPEAKVHVLNSGGVLRFPEYAYDFVRAGLMLYGSAYPSEYQPLLRQAMTWKARVNLVREVGPGRSLSYGRTYVTPHAMRVATLAVGYADGFPRQCSGQGAEVVIEGRRCAVLGRVTMDQILADITEVPNVSEGTEAILTGPEIPAAELAEKAGTIAWDIFTGVKGRVEKFYFDA